MTPRGRSLNRPVLCLLGAILAANLVGCQPAHASTSEALSADPGATQAITPEAPGPSTGMPTALEPDPPTPTTTPPRLFRLTEPGCCVRPFWSPDSLEVAYVDKPPGKELAGIYSIPLEGGSSHLIYRRPQILSADWALSAWAEGEDTRVWRRSDGRSWLVDTTGAAPRFAPSGSMMAWGVTSKQYTQIDVRQTAIWVAGIDGSRARKVITVQGGSLIGWAIGEQALLVSGRLRRGEAGGVWRVPLEAAEPVMLFSADRVRDPLLSPGGTWLAFYVAFSSEADADGLWVLDTLTGASQRITPFGSYRWRTADRLLLFPLEASLPSAELWEVDVRSGDIQRLTERGLTPLAIANNDWLPSPDGRSLAFVSAVDHAIWILELPQPAQE